MIIPTRRGVTLRTSKVSVCLLPMLPMLGTVPAREVNDMGDATGPVGIWRAEPRVGAHATDRRARNELIGLLALYLITLAVSFVKGQDVFVFAYIMTVVVAVGGPRRHGRAWADIGIKADFFADLRRVWPLSALVAIVFQVLSPAVGIAFAAGYGHELLAQISGRLPVDIASTAGLSAVVALLAAALVLTLIEELVFRAFFQERLSRYVGTPLAIVVAAVLFGLAHAVGASGSSQVVLSDAGGVMFDGPSSASSTRGPATSG